MPDPLGIVAGEMAELMSLNEKNSRRLYDHFWGLPRTNDDGSPRRGSPLPKQDLIRNTYYDHAQKFPKVLQTYNDYGSIRSGKTDGILAKFSELMFKHPGTRALAMRRLMTEIFNSIFDSILKFYKKIDMKEGEDFRLRRGDAPRIWLPNGSEWIFMPWEKADKAKEGKLDTLGGAEFALAWIEEANEAKRGVFDTVQGRMSQRDALPAPMVVLSHNPPSQEHWLYKDFYQEDPGPHHFNVHFSLEDNRVNLGDEYVDDIKNRYKDSPTLYRKFYLGQYAHTVDGVAIFKNRFKRGTHIAAEPLRWDPEQKMVGVWDFGFVKPCLLVLQDDERTGQIKVFYVLMGNEERIDAFAARMKNFLHRSYPGANWRWICDIAGKKRSPTSPKTEVNVLEAILGAKCEMGRSLIPYGISLINEQLAIILPKGSESVNGSVPAVILDPANANILADALEFGYCQDPDAKKDEIKPKRDMYYEHCVDCLRYFMVRSRELTTSKMRKNPEERQWRSITNKGFQQGTSMDDIFGKDDEYFASYGFGRKNR